MPYKDKATRNTRARIRRATWSTEQRSREAERSKAKRDRMTPEQRRAENDARNERNRRNPEARRAVERRWRENHHDKHIQNNIEWRKKNPGYRTMMDKKLAETENGRKQLRARRTVSSAIDNGRITRQPCTHCGAIPAEAHHEDYDSPLQITWLCKFHHRRRHSVLGHTIRVVETV